MCYTINLFFPYKTGVLFNNNELCQNGFWMKIYSPFSQSLTKGGIFVFEVNGQ